MRIGELAEAAGVPTRAVRHYHRIGLLPEPPRRVNGYRTYGVRDVLRLARVRRLTELGLSLDEAADVLADDEGRELGEILAEIDADLARQEVEIRQRRERLAELHRRAADGPLDADDAVSVPTAELLDRITTAFPGSDAARRDREFLALLDKSGAAALVAQQYREVLHDPEVVARTAKLYRRFDELATRAVDNPEVTELARDFAASVPMELVHPHTAGPSGLRVRDGAGLDVRIPWDAVAGARRVRRSRDGRTVQVDGATLHVVISNQTTVEVTLGRPVTVALTGGRAATVTELRFHADDAAGLVATVRARADVIPGRALVLNRAVAVAEVDGPQAALGLVDDLGLDGYHLFHAIRADLLRRLGRDAEAAEAYEAAIARTRNDAEREFLRRRRRSVGT